MVFSSIVFLFYFFPVVLATYYLFPKARDTILLVASLFFYAWGEKLYVLLLFSSISFNFLVARELEQRSSTERRLWLATGVSLNLLLLGVLKYGVLVHRLAASLCAGLGCHLSTYAAPELPLGISFFTFQAISYLVDVYRKDVPAEKSWQRLAIYIAMFPHLVAGPIVRFKTIVGDLHRRRLTTVRFNVGIKYLIVGLAQKSLIANVIASAVDRIFTLPTDTLTPALAWTGIGGYTLQIYYDFAGYSNMAIGLAWMLGLRFPMNFNYPYSSLSVTEFWRRWHISLSRWFRDYLYIPLGGNQRGAGRTYLNLVIVFLLCGLWHGASLTFVAWGLYHGAFLVLERAGGENILARTPTLLRRVYTLLVVAGGWVLFRSDSFQQAWTFYGVLLGNTAGLPSAYVLSDYLQSDVNLALLLGVVFSLPVVPWLEHRMHKAQRPAVLRHAVPGFYVLALLVLLVMSAGMLASQSYNPFIYFRF